MLILTRKKNESIIIDGSIEVKIIEIEDGKIRIGIEAPKEIEILRKELYDKMKEENKAAVNVGLSLDSMKKLIKRK